MAESTTQTTTSSDNRWSRKYGSRISEKEKMKVGKRKLTENKCGDRTTHCVYPEEHDVYSEPVPTSAPTTLPIADAATNPDEENEEFLILETVEPTMAPTQSPTYEQTQSPTKRPNQAYFEFSTTTRNPTFNPTQLFPTASPSLHDAVDELPTSPPSSMWVEQNDDEGLTTDLNEYDVGLPTSFPSAEEEGEQDESEEATINGDGNSGAWNYTFTTEEIDENEQELLPVSVNPTSAPSPVGTDFPTLTASFAESSTQEPTTDIHQTAESLTTAPTVVSTANANQDDIGSEPSSSSEFSTNTEEADGPGSSPSSAPGSTPTTGNNNPTQGTSPSTTANNPPGSSTTGPCKSDSEGNFGEVTGSQSMVRYRYQIETKPKLEITRGDLNQAILQMIEKSISDIMVTSFFADALCRKDVTARQFIQHRMLEDGDAVVGLSADPADRVLEGDLGEACPFPATDAVAGESDVPSCFVVGGAMSFFLEGEDHGDLSWIDQHVQASLREAMIIGALDNVDPAIAHIQYIPPYTDLTTVTIEDDATNTNSAVAVGDQKPAEISSVRAWPWVLGSFGFVGVVVASILFYRKRKKLNESTDFDSMVRSPKGSFPGPIDIVDENSEFDQDEIYKDDDDEEEKNEDFIIARPPSWRQVPEPRQKRSRFAQLHINAMDPNQPVVKPVLDEEAETYISNV